MQLYFSKEEKLQLLLIGFHSTSWDDVSRHLQCAVLVLVLYGEDETLGPMNQQDLLLGRIL
jgi:hypothetical protein